jgi:hypothetical protein
MSGQVLKVKTEEDLKRAILEDTLNGFYSWMICDSSAPHASKYFS